MELNMYKAPDYCPDAIATDTGWVNPRNGELLVAVKQLKQKIAEHQLQPVEQIVDVLPIIEEVLPEIAVIGDGSSKDHIVKIDDSVVAEEEIPAKRRPGRPKTKK